MSNKKHKDEKNDKRQKDDKNQMFNIIITSITAVVIITLVCVTIIVSKSQKPTQENENSVAATPQDGTNAPVNPLDLIKTYQTSETGSVSETDSKTLAYFTSHYKNDYYRVNEIEYSIVAEGSYTEYYETETVAYSTQGYLYNKKTHSSYNEQNLSPAIVQLYTPTNSYIMYTDMKTYFKGDQNTQGYKNNIDFPGDSFKTGKININGREYYYEETTDENGITYRYCFDENNNLMYNIATATAGTITTRYIEYSSNVDYSLFEIPKDYTLAE